MHNSFDAAKFLDDKDPELSKGSSQIWPNDDSFFLLYLIMGIYLGPNVQEERPTKSVLQRRAEGLPPYTHEQLGASHLPIEELEHIYYMLLKKADKSVVVQLLTFHKFIEGNLTIDGQDATAICPQFPDLFPLQLHPHLVSINQSRLVENIIFINYPNISYLKPEDIERFTSLTGLQDFALTKNSIKLGSCLFDVEVQTGRSDMESPIISDHDRLQRKRRSDDIMKSENPLPDVPVATPVKDIIYSRMRKTYNLASVSSRIDFGSRARDGPAMIVVPSCSTIELDSMLAYAKNAYALTGSAVKGQVGPVIGLMDIGECEETYLFRVALPGVKREDRAFRCEVDSDGKVLIKGETTTGEKTVYRYSQAFKMQTKNLCPPGPFSISFHLPGPVDPRQFSGIFGTDGILEGIVVKAIHP
ncbi:hypothetical protein Nepgr_015005 [Nepenthes gracilis]|uniref:SHSP domain-containing protein n=1 Tax=Nepenthes gracilis TaxID=150966 RepID=A0AAD3SLU9_NEPGR|nr:hypothetical protein Nepgr_015005 [Nepenthes gracilis]